MMSSKIYSFGHWVVGNQKYFSKMLAFEAAFRLEGQHYPHWNYYEEEFSQHNWMVEPHESLLDLYTERARKIREQYDYVMVKFSGGCDSWNIIDSFIRGNLLVNEVHTTATDQWSDPSRTEKIADNLMNEHLFASIPGVKKLIERDPRIKFRLFEESNEMIKWWSKNTVSGEEYNHLQSNFPIREFSRGHNSNVPQGARAVTLFGIDKPKVLYVNNRYYMVFFDAQPMSQLRKNRTLLADPNDIDQAFYWHPESIKILAKQAHIVKKWFKENPKFLPLLNTILAYGADDVYQRIVNRLIYPTYDFGTWQAPKSKKFWDMETWKRFMDHPDSAATQNWRKSVKHYSDSLVDIYSKHGRLDDTTAPLINRGWYYSLPGCYSKMYDLGP